VALADGEYHSTRFINLPGTSGTLHGDPSLFMAGTQFRAGYEFAFNNFYVQPYGDLAVLYTNLRSFSESGPTPAALYYHGDGKVTVALSPMVELGGRIDLNDKTILRPFGELGASFIPDNSRSMEASFVGANSENGLFRSYLDSPGATADLGIGIELYRACGLELKAEYDATVGGSYISQNASAKLAYDF
jgi:outer membrane autotransporter protein